MGDNRIFDVLGYGCNIIISCSECGRNMEITPARQIIERDYRVTKVEWIKKTPEYIDNFLREREWRKSLNGKIICKNCYDRSPKDGTRRFKLDWDWRVAVRWVLAILLALVWFLLFYSLRW